MSNLFYSLTHCHFCKVKLESNHIGFASLTDYHCRDKKCNKKFGYCVAYDDALNLYYQIEFFYRGNNFQFCLGKDDKYYTKLRLRDYTVFKLNEVVEVTTTKEINKVINRYKKLSILK